METCCPNCRTIATETCNTTCGAQPVPVTGLAVLRRDATGASWWTAAGEPERLMSRTAAESRLERA